MLLQIGFYAPKIQEKCMCQVREMCLGKYSLLSTDGEVSMLLLIGFYALKIQNMHVPGVRKVSGMSSFS